MNKRFKKVISSVLAAVMTLGVVSVANVSSVFAGDGDSFTITADNFYPASTSTSDSKQATTAFTINGVEISKLSETPYYKTYGAYANTNNNGTLTNDSGKTWTSELVMGKSNTSFSFTPLNDGKITVYFYTGDTGSTIKIDSVTSSDTSKYKVKTVSGNCSANTKCTITMSSSKVVFLEMDYVAGPSKSYENVITGNVTLPDGAEVSEFTLTDANNNSYKATVKGDGTYTATITKKITASTTLTPSLSGYTTDSVVTLTDITDNGSTTDVVKNTATGSDVVFTKLQTHSVTATVKDENGNAISDATIYYEKDKTVDSDTKKSATNENGQFTIADFTTSADVYVQRADYWTAHVTYTEADSDAVITLSRVAVQNTGDNTFSTANFNKPDDSKYAGEDAWSRTQIKDSYTANGFTYTGNGAYIYYTKSKTDLQSAASNSGEGTKITYTPAVNGKITLNIRPAGSVSTTQTRGFSVNGEKTWFSESSSNYNTYTYNATAGEEFTIEVIGTSMSNIKSVEFTPVSSFEYVDTQKSSDGTSLYVIGKIKKSAISTVDEVGFIAAKTDDKNMSTTEVATKVVDGTTTIVDADNDYYFAATKITIDDNASSIVITPYSMKDGTITRGSSTTYTIS